MKSGRELRLMPRGYDHGAEERKTDLPAVRVAAKQEVDAAAAEEIDDVRVMADGDGRRVRIDIRERAVDVRMTAVNLVDAHDRQRQRDGCVREKAHSARGHRRDNIVGAGPVIVVAENCEDAVAGVEVRNEVA